MIPNDFDVALVFQDDDASLFAARRPDVWHFVLATTKRVAPNYQSIDIGQFQMMEWYHESRQVIGATAATSLILQSRP